MKTTNNANSQTVKPTVVGTGLIALDLVVEGSAETQTRYYAGGTCGNVLTILSFLGWNSYPIARLNGDFTSEWVRNDLKRFGVHTDYLSLKPTGPVPVIIEWITEDKHGRPRHKYSFACPTCGSRKPGHKPVPVNEAESILPKTATPEVFFFDRVSRAALVLAVEFHRRGALIVFEPSGIGDPKLFLEALALTHILKYSSDRMSDSIAPYKRNMVLVEIETLGEEGVRFKCNIPSYENRKWKRLRSFSISRLKDAAGSGDWFTASFISRIGCSGKQGLTHASEEALVAAFRFAQAAAAWNCGFEAPRGGMYTVDQKHFVQQVRSLEAGKLLPNVTPTRRTQVNPKTSPNGACLHCHSARPRHVHEITRQVRSVPLMHSLK